MALKMTFAGKIFVCTICNRSFKVRKGQTLTECPSSHHYSGPVALRRSA